MNSTTKTSAGGETEVPRRKLVDIKVVEGDDRPLHIYSKETQKLIARLPKDADVNAFLNRLSEEVFYE